MESRFEMSVRELLARPPFRYRAVPPEEMALFCRALTHDSAGDGKPVDSYERLEFLGDAVLELIACEEAYRDDSLAEGSMTAIKQDWVANHRISENVLAYGLRIDDVLRVGGGHLDSSGVHRISEGMRADCFEALLAAVYITRGLEEARRIAREVTIRAPSCTDRVRRLTYRVHHRYTFRDNSRGDRGENPQHGDPRCRKDSQSRSRCPEGVCGIVCRRHAGGFPRRFGVGPGCVARLPPYGGIALERYPRDGPRRRIRC